MTDEPAQPTGEPEGEPTVKPAGSAPERARIEPSRAGRRVDVLPLLYFVGFVVLAGTMYYLWENPPAGHLAPQEAVRVDTMQSELAALRADLTRIDQRPPSADFVRLQQEVQTLSRQAGQVSRGDLDALRQRLDVVEGRSAVSPEQVVPLAQQGLGPLTQRVEALEHRPVLDPARIDALERQVRQSGSDLEGLKRSTDAAEARLTQGVQALQSGAAQIGTQMAQQVAQVNGQIAQVNGQIEQLRKSGEEATSRFDQRLQELQSGLEQNKAALAGLEQQQKQAEAALQETREKLQRAAKLQGAGAALAAGQPLGEIPGAPPALAKFARTAPPTEAGLRGSFERYAEAARKASEPGPGEGQDFGSRLWNRAQQAVTVRQGDHVLVGDPIAGVLAHARDLLDRGDLEGSVKAAKELQGPALQAMQPWIDQAQTLIDARAAFAELTAG